MIVVSLVYISIPSYKNHTNITKNESKYANQNHQFQVTVDFPLPLNPNKQTQQVLEITYTIPQRKNHKSWRGVPEKIPPIKGVQQYKSKQYKSNFTIHPM
jgi:hypothetical protein